MKKCASCTKDLPEAALHCVFCGAKQPPVPAVQGGLAKTAFGYSASDMEQMKTTARPAPGSQPPPHMQATLAQPPGPSASYGQFAPTAGPAGAATMLAPQGLQSPPTRPAPPSRPPAYAPPAPSGMGIHAVRMVTPPPLPAVVADPYLSTPSRGARPTEPWKHSLRIVMFLWGALMLAAFATPLSMNPRQFNWDLIMHAEGAMKVMALLTGAVGVLALLLAAIPMPTSARGILAALLGLSGIVVPIALTGEVPPWTALVGLGGMIVLVPGLLARHEYVDSLATRLIVTLGVVCVLSIVLVPTDGEIPLIQLVKHLIDAEGKAKIEPAMALGAIALVVLALLVWLPGPATAGSKALAWLILLWGTLITQIVALVVMGNIGDVISATPNGALMAWVPAAAYLALIGYGLATVIGKQLE